MDQLQNKVTIITGASSGIGKAIATAFATTGAHVVLTARNLEKLNEVAGEITAAGGKASVIPADITVEEQVVNLFREIKNKFGKVDILVNNAGTATATAVDQLSLAEWQRVMDINLTAAFLCSREAFKLMKQQSAGRIINIGSVSAKVPRPNTAPYVASKAGLEGLTRALALEGRESGITVTVLHPGNTLSGFWLGMEDMAAAEGIMAPEQVARMALTIAAMPDDVLVLESVMLPLKMPFLGRG